MKTSKKLLIVMICFSLILSSCGKLFSDKKPQPLPASQEELQMLIDRGGLTAPEIARELELKPNKSYEDLIDLGTSYIWMGEYLKAAEAYEVAARQANSKPKLVGALYDKAIALGYANQMQEALHTLDYSANIDPGNIQVAWLRYAFYRYSGNTFGMAVSADQLITLDPSLSGNEILGWEWVVIIVTAIVVVVPAATVITETALVPPNERKDVVVGMMNDYKDILVSAADTTHSYGRLLVEGLDGGK